MRYAIFLRGVNVGGINLKMADVRRVLSDIPLADVTTLLASGNVVCTSDAGAEELKTLVERALRTAFGYDAWVVVLTADRLEELVEACPYPADSSSEHTYVAVTSDPAVLDEVQEAVTALDLDARHTRLGPEAAAWVAPVGGTLAAPWASVSGKTRYKPALTERNLRTMHKVLRALRSAPG
ncbi:MAG: pyridoxamine 5-phosphate oxidase [Actinotalea sp.]|nr:pyridoxamine 5-phosphate oxidase [Actinotalea sp.]